MSQDTGEEELQASLKQAVKVGDLTEVLRLIGDNTNNSWKHDSCSLVCSAIKFEHFHIVKLLVEKGADWADPEYYGGADSPLHLATRVGALELAEIMIGSGPPSEWTKIDTSRPNHELETPLHIATQRNDEPMVRLLIKGGAYRFSKDSYGIVPLFTACVKGAMNIAKLLTPEKHAETLELALFLAAAQGHEEVFSFLVNSADSEAVAGFPFRNLSEVVNHFNESGPSPLFWACEKGHPGVVKLLLEYGVQINPQRPTDNYTALHVAIDKGHEKVVELLLQNGADPNLKTNGDITALLLAAVKRHLYIVELLLGKLVKPLLASKSEISKVSQILLGPGTCPEAKDEDDTMCVAAKKGYVRVVEILIANTTLPKEKIVASNILHLAVCNGRIEVVKLLMKSGWDIKDTVEVFLKAVTSKCSEICKVLINRGIDVNFKDPLKGERPLHAAVRQGLEEVVVALIKAGADISSRDQENATPLHVAAAYGDTQIIRSLLKNGAEVDSVREDGRTPLLIAACRGTQEPFDVLIEAGADVNVCDEENITPLLVVNGHNKLDMVKTLLKKKACVNVVKNDGKTPLHIAAFGGDPDIAAALIEAGAFVNARDNKNYTPLHFAANAALAFKGLELLLESGANVSAQTISKETAFHILVKKNEYFCLDYRSCCELFFNQGFDINLEDSSGCTVLDLLFSKKFASRQYNKWVVDLLKFIIKAKVAGLYLSDKTLQAYHNLDENNKYKLNNFLQGCLQEVERLKCERVSDQHTLFDVLVKHQSPTYARNDSIMLSLKSFSHMKFPVYGKRIAINIENCKKRLELMNDGHSLTGLLKVQNFVSENKYPTLPGEVLEEVITYLSNEDLESLILCRKNLTCQPKD